MHSQGEVVKTWRRRWFILKQGFLFRFSSPDVSSTTKPRGVVDLSKVTDVSEAREQTGRHNTFKLSTETGYVAYVCDSETELVEWISALEGAVSAIVRKVEHAYSFDVNLLTQHGTQKKIVNLGLSSASLISLQSPFQKTGHLVFARSLYKYRCSCALIHIWASSSIQLSSGLKFSTIFACANFLEAKHSCRLPEWSMSQHPSLLLNQQCREMIGLASLKRCTAARAEAQPIEAAGEIATLAETVTLW